MSFPNPGPVMLHLPSPLSPIFPNLPGKGPKRAFDQSTEPPSKRFRISRHRLYSSRPLIAQSTLLTPRAPLRTATSSGHLCLMTSSSTMDRPALARADSLDGAGQGFASITMNDSPPSAASPLGGSGVNSSPTTLPPVLTMKRPNPKRLSLSLDVVTSTLPVPAASDTPSTIASGITRDTPITPGPPRTPALAMAPPSGRPKPTSRPSLLTLVTQPALGQHNDVPPTPGASTASTRVVRPKIRLRSSSSGTESITDTIEARSARSASLGYPAVTVSSISEDSAANFASSSSSSPPGSTYTSLSTPPLMEEHPEEPYSNGPVELFKGVYLGAEDSVFHWKSYAGSSSRVRILNVAQEIDDPFATDRSKGKEKEKIDLAAYEADANRPKVEYAHLLWGHGESGLADIPAGSTLDQIIQTKPLSGREEKWGFWEAIQWMEEARRKDVPVLIHCQCGVSRSATLAIAYIMTLAVSGLLPDVLGHLKNMQDAYDLVKAKSSAIGPNVSLVFQLVEYGRNLTSLLTAHPHPVRTSFPRSTDVESEAEWAARRREFDDLEIESEEDKSNLGVEGFTVSPLLKGQDQSVGLTAKEEADKLDEAMKMRKKSKNFLAPLVTG